MNSCCHPVKPQLGRHLFLFVLSFVLTLPLLAAMVAHLLNLSWALSSGLQAVLATLVQFGTGWSFYRNTGRALRAGRADMDTLIALGTSAAYGYSLVVFLLDLPRPLYFETSALIITLVLLGRVLETLSSAKASQAIEQLIALQPKMARVQRDGEWLDVSVSEIRVGDLFLVRPGEAVPVDGEVIEGNSLIDESLLTGESTPVSKTVGARIFAATQNQQGSLHGKALAVGAATALASIIQMIEGAQQSKAPVQRAVDRVSAIFTPFVFLVALGTLFVWWLSGTSFPDALINAVSVLIVACPCALGLATPTVMLVASGRAARSGILIRDMASLQKACKMRALVVDKTATLTEGKPTVAQLLPLAGVDAQKLLSVAASLAHYSTHPLSDALTRHAAACKLVLFPVTHFEAIAGRGMQGVLQGQRAILGSLRYLEELGLPTDRQLTSRFSTEEQTPLAVALDGALIGFVLIADLLRPTSLQAMRMLRQMGIHLVLLTGDNRLTAGAVARRVGIEEYRAEVLPHQKLQEIQRLKTLYGIVGMVGDGINDAPALAAADVSFAFGSGSDIALQSADLMLVRNDLADIPKAIALSHLTLRKIWQNLFFAGIYNSIGIALAASGLLNPVIAAIAMACSSVSVVLNALSLRE